jgi:hypothetical protein
MEELIFLVKESDEGGYIAQGVGISIITEAETIPELREEIKDAVHCHFEDSNSRLVRLS